MPLNTAASNGKAELTAAGLLGVQIESGHAQPTNGQLFESVSHLEDAQHATRDFPSSIDRGLEILVLQRPLAGNAQPRRTEIVATGLVVTFGAQRGIDKHADLFMDLGTVIEIQHQNGTPVEADLPWRASRSSRKARSFSAIRSCSTSMCSW